MKVFGLLESYLWRLHKMIDKFWSKKLLFGGERTYLNYLALAQFTDGIRFLIGSEDGKSWKKITTRATAISDARLNGGMVYGNGKYVFTDGITLSYSETGYSWTTVGLPEKAYNRDLLLSFANGKFLYIVHGGNIYISEDLLNWTQSTVPFTALYKNLIYHKAAGKYILVTTKGIATSSDGINWTTGTTATNDTSSYNGIVYSEGKGIASLFSDSSNRINLEYSSNATTWTAVSGVTNSLSKGAAAPQSKVLFTSGENGIIDYTAGTSTVKNLAYPSDFTSASTWSIQSISWYDNRFYLVGMVNSKGIICYSEDNGTTWTTCTDVPANVTSVYKIISNLREG